MSEEKYNHEMPCADLRVLMAHFADKKESSEKRDIVIFERLGNIEEKIDDITKFRWQTIGTAIGVSTMISFAGIVLTLFLMWRP